MDNSIFFSRYDQTQPPRAYSNPLAFTVRVAQQKDLAGLVDVLSSSFHSRTGLMRWLFPIFRMGVYEDLRQRLRSPLSSDYVCLVAVSTPSESPSDPSTVVGTVEITLRSTSLLQFCDLPYPYLSNLAVRSECRRQGIAQKLLSVCERTVVDGGFRDVYLHVLENNHSARQLYFKAGYRLQKADPLWRCWLFKQPRRLLLHKSLIRGAVS